jgi:hypothetical protein
MVEPRPRRGLLSGCLMVTFGVIVMVIAFIMVVHLRLRAAVDTCFATWTYPYAAVVRGFDLSFLQTDGIASRVLETPDDRADVIVWRAEHARANRDVLYGAFETEPLPNGGTRILLICP